MLKTMKRKRPVTSCLQCRRRRVRCDRERPVCARCDAGGLHCEYEEPVTGGASQRIAVRPRPTSASPTRVHSQRREPGQPIETLEAFEASTTQRDLHDKGQVSVFHGGRSLYRGSTHWANAIPLDLDQDDESEYEIPLQKSSLFPGWPPKEDDGFDLSGQRFRPLRADPSLTSSSFEKCKFCGRRYSMSCLMALLPSQETSEKLCDLFFCTVFPLAPILHVKGFAEDFRAFWHGADSIAHNSDPNPFLKKNPGFLCLLSAILFASLVSTPQARLKGLLGAKTEVDANEMYFVVTVSSSLTGFPRRPGIHSLAAYVFAHGQFIREEEFSDTHDFVSTAFRVALSMGLHRHLPEAGFSVAESETRRRLWWYILHLDVMSSVSSGLSPLFIDDKMANTNVISQHDQLEEDIQPGVNENDVRYLVASQRFTITRAIRNVLRNHFEDSFQSPEQVRHIELQLEKVSEKIREITRSLLSRRDQAIEESERPSTVSKPFDSVWKLRPDRDDKEVLDFSAWSVFLLHMMIHKAYCALYHPLVRDPVIFGDERTRTRAVKHAQAFLQLFFRVCNDPVSEAFHWMYPGTYQPLQAMSLLLADLLQHPHSDHAGLSQGLVDAVFDLYQVDHGIITKSNPPHRRLSPAGRAAWTILIRTRRKALEQIGVDHHVLFPSSSVLSNFCICGERISHDDLDRSQEPKDQEERQPSPSPDPVFDLPEDFQGPLDEQILPSSTDFDWDAWDHALGQAGGIAP